MQKFPTKFAHLIINQQIFFCQCQILVVSNRLGTSELKRVKSKAKLFHSLTISGLWNFISLYFQNIGRQKFPLWAILLKKPCRKSSWKITLNRKSLLKKTLSKNLIEKESSPNLVKKPCWMNLVKKLLCGVFYLHLLQFLFI